MVSDALWRTQGYDVTHFCLALFGFGWKWHNAYLLSIIGEFSRWLHRYVTFFGLMFFAHRELNLMILYQGQGSCCWSLLRIIILFLQSPDMCKVCTRPFLGCLAVVSSSLLLWNVWSSNPSRNALLGLASKNLFFCLFSFLFPLLFICRLAVFHTCWFIADLLISWFCWFHLYLQLICILNACSYCWLWRFYISCDSLKLLSLW